MAGSLQKFVYEDDGGLKYWVRLDESNARAFDFPFLAADGSNAPQGEKPGSLQMRYVLFKSDDGLMARKFYCPTVDNSKYLNGGNLTVATLNGNAALVKPGRLYSRHGEKRNLDFAVGAGTEPIPDTGLNDGTPEG